MIIPPPVSSNRYLYIVSKYSITKNPILRAFYRIISLNFMYDLHKYYFFLYLIKNILYYNII